MTESASIQLFAVAVVYKISCQLTGLGLAYMGYRLISTGLYEKAAELEAAWGNKKLKLKQLGPGIFFSLVGSVIIGFAIWRGVEFDIPQTASAPSPEPRIEQSEDAKKTETSKETPRTGGGGGGGGRGRLTLYF